ncbi:unnamed protein product [Cylicocyclus nassatus]|uniref:Uncharacterized protein n=1 Tax=Cylicocyclus nassatus TaxID=53992 RepID=A0AA36GSY8_CYLNA|nr:unnamed protein product [Cylicocyclus nassatus]
MPEELSAFSTSILMQLGQNLVPATMLLLAIIAILASLGFAFVLVAFLKQKRTSGHVAVKPRYQPFSPARCGIAKKEDRYVLAWEHTQPLTYWLFSSSKSEPTMTSPPELTSSIGLRSSIVVSYSFRSGGTVPQTRLYHHIPSTLLRAPDVTLDWDQCDICCLWCSSDRACVARQLDTRCWIWTQASKNDLEWPFWAITTIDRRFRD